MSTFNPDKLYVQYRTGVTLTRPVMHRSYTLTHSDKTGELFLNIGLKYAYDKITYMRDEVLGRWEKEFNQYFLSIFLHVDGKDGTKVAALRNDIFRKELPLALQAIVYGDGYFFYAHRFLYSSPIIVHFQSIYDEYNKVENWGSIYDYEV